jgi:hypothetical protein
MLKKHRSNTAIVVVALVALLISWAFVYADEPPIPHDYTQDVGEKYIFVMLSTDDPSVWAADIQDENIRNQYSKSGLYIKGENTPLWTVVWFAFRVNISSDGKYMVRWGDWPIIHYYDAMALEFYDNGQVIKSYTVKDLVASPSLLPETVSHYEWEETSSFDSEHNILWLKTLNKEEYTFDITTGEIIKKFLPPTEVPNTELPSTDLPAKEVVRQPSLQIILIVCGAFTVIAGLVLYRRFKG